MPRLSNSERLAAVHAKALRQFDDIQSAVRDERMQCLEDRRFYSISGAQWEGPLAQQFQSRPRFEVNKIHLAVMRIINEYRNNRITVDFVAKDGSNPNGLDDVCDKLYRADEQSSVASEAYDNAFEEAVGGGFGAWRLRTDYADSEDDDSEYQKICFEPIYDADSCVFFDLDSKRQDKADAKFCFVLTAMGHDAYREAWDDEPNTFYREIHHTEFDWLTPDVVYVCEYYVVEKAHRVIHIFKGIDESERKVSSEDLEDEMEVLLATGFTEVRQKRTDYRRVHKYILSGSKVLEDCGIIAGNEIPIVPVFGKRWIVDGVERCMGHVRLAKDAQRLKNMQLSKLGEISALGSVEKPIFVPEQVAGHQLMWSEDNIKDYPYLLVNPLTDANGQTVTLGPTAYTKAPEIPPALAALLQVTEQDMIDLLGGRAEEPMVSNISGKAVELIQSRRDIQAFIYTDNFAKAIKRCGEIWLSMAREVYADEGRTMRGLSAGGETEAVELLKPTVSESGEIAYEADLSKAKFDVVVSVGPSSETKRQATVRALTGMMSITQDPETLSVLGSLAITNLEGEGIGEVRNYFRQRLLRMGVLKPSKEEAEALAAESQGAAPGPEAQYLMAAAEQAQAASAKARADTILSIARAEESRAKAAKTISDIDASEIGKARALFELERDSQPEPGASYPSSLPV